MSAPKHTPGPWRVSEVLAEKTIYAGGLHIASVWMDTPADFEANARLIAAAPELLAALKRVQATLNCEQGRISGEGEAWKLFCELITAVPAAIAKAEGRHG